MLRELLVNSLTFNENAKQGRTHFERNHFELLLAKKLAVHPVYSLALEVRRQTSPKPHVAAICSRSKLTLRSEINCSTDANNLTTVARNTKLLSSYGLGKMLTVKV